VKCAARKSPLAAARLDQRVILQSRSVTQDAAGQDAIVWVAVATVWAQVQALRGREFFAAAQMQMETTVKVRMRYRADVLPTWRLLIDGKAHDITAVITVGRKEMTEIMCLQGVKDGR
jgi:SPP1 family predicted phage head-tail adaptor